jgi:hypothetical protein
MISNVRRIGEALQTVGEVLNTLSSTEKTCIGLGWPMYSGFRLSLMICVVMFMCTCHSLKNCI